MTASAMRSWESFEKSMRNFEWLGTAAPGASDIDFVCERRGSFLMMEFKPMQGNGVHVGFGQHLMLEALTKLPKVTLYLVGEVESTGSLYVLNYAQVEPQRFRTAPVLFRKAKFMRATKESLRLLVGEWFHGV